METVTLVVTPNETSYSNVVLAAQLRRRHSQRHRLRFSAQTACMDWLKAAKRMNTCF